MHANLVLMLAAPLLTGCGAMMVPGPFLVPVDSEPRGATVVYAGKTVGVTPCVVAMQRRPTQLELHHADCHPRIVDVGTEDNRWVAGNFATLGLGMLVDFALGNQRESHRRSGVRGPRSHRESAARPLGARRPSRLDAEPEPQNGNDALRGLGQLLAGVLQAVDYHNRRH
jgi:hypothetical protein